VTAAVHDTNAIRLRRQELFGWPEVILNHYRDRERFGTLNDHCGICPKAPDENCGLTCDNERRKLNDGVTVT